MSAELRPIHDRSRRAYLSETEAMAVEWRRASWGEIVAEREERIQIELRELRRINAGLAADNQHLAGDNDTVQADNARLTTERDHAERAAGFWFAVTLVLAIFCAAFAIWD